MTISDDARRRLEAKLAQRELAREAGDGPGLDEDDGAGELPSAKDILARATSLEALIARRAEEAAARGETYGAGPTNGHDPASTQALAQGFADDAADWQAENHPAPVSQEIAAALEGEAIDTTAAAARQAGNGHDEGAPMAPAGIEADLPIPQLVAVTPFNWIGKKAPDRQWLVKDWINIGSVTGLYGDGGIGKSLLLQQLQTSCAAALGWVGLYAQPCVSLGFYCEDVEDELHRRQEWINEGYGCDMNAASGAIYVPRVGMNNTLMTFTSRGVGELTKLYDQWREYALDVRASLVVIDTAADVFAGNEIDRGQVRQFVQMVLGSLALAIGGAILLAAHPSQAGLAGGQGTSGSTGWNNAFRSRMYLDYPKKKDDDDAEPPDLFARVLRRMKGNYAPPEGVIDLHWKDGLLVPDVFQGPRSPCAEVYLKLLDTFEQEGKRISANWQSQTYGPTAFGKRPRAEREGYHKGAFETAQSELFRERSIMLLKLGPPTKQVDIIVRAPIEKASQTD